MHNLHVTYSSVLLIVNNTVIIQNFKHSCS